jgi:hypothetical protein
MHGGAGASASDTKPVKPNGMPLLTDEEKDKANLAVGFAFTLLSLGVGTGIAFAIYGWGATAKYDASIDAVRAIVHRQWQCVSFSSSSSPSTPFCCTHAAPTLGPLVVSSPHLRLTGDTGCL